MTPASRAQQIYGRFKAFHAEHPEFYAAIERFSLQVIESGRARYGIAAVLERVRWHMNIERRQGDDVKINNDYKPYYARMFAAKHPEHADFFSTRRRTSEDKPPYGLDIPVLSPLPAVGEHHLMEELRRL